MFSIYDDVVPCTSLKISVAIWAYLGTMGAVDLYAFILGYLIDVALSTV